MIVSNDLRITSLILAFQLSVWLSKVLIIKAKSSIIESINTPKKARWYLASTTPENVCSWCFVTDGAPRPHSSTCLWRVLTLVTVQHKEDAVVIHEANKVPVALEMQFPFHPLDMVLQRNVPWLSNGYRAAPLPLLEIPLVLSHTYSILSSKVTHTVYTSIYTVY